MDSSQIRIFIVDDHPMIRAGLAALVRAQPSFELVGEADNGVDAVREIVNPLEVVELPRAPKSVRGVASFRGEVVPVIDLRIRFGTGTEGPEERVLLRPS